MLKMRTLRCSESSGQSMVETGIALLILLPVVFWMFEICMMAYTISVIHYASRAAVQYAATHGVDAPNCSGPVPTGSSVVCPDPSGELVQQVVTNLTTSNGHPVPVGDVTPSWHPDNSPNSTVEVTVNYQYKPWIVLPFTQRKITGTATGTIVY